MYFLGILYGDGACNQVQIKGHPSRVCLKSPSGIPAKLVVACRISRTAGSSIGNIGKPAAEGHRTWWKRSTKPRLALDFGLLWLLAHVPMFLARGTRELICWNSHFSGVGRRWKEPGWNGRGKINSDIGSIHERVCLVSEVSVSRLR
ncbi:hypothetical protein LB506_001165 [Fusarium annulatum]|nr:hypothetical protein LB506_001165 [Fusarium annulatum]